ncbi:MAG: L-threonine 3-dehydrogenase [Armatimonadetes bacterium]|nr:L-threonine 3-dehydrogenase [Armatimonadota bacterium]
MKKLMKAVLKTKAQKGAEILNLEIPELKFGEVLVKVKTTSICGTDVHIWEWDNWAQNRIKNLPQILGHELAGEVVKIGDGVKNLKLGDYISAETHIPCKNCIQCLTGQEHICGNLKILGVDCNGAFAEFIALPEIVCWRNSPELPYEVASVQEPLGNAIYATLVEDVAGKKVAVIGEGPTGLFAVGVAKVSGATEIYILGKHPYRMEIARKMGADHLVFVNQIDPIAYILEKTKNVGVDIVLEMAGSQEAINLGFKIIRKGGRFSAFGIPSEKVTLDYSGGIIFKGITVYGINGREMYKTWFKTKNFLSSKRLDITPVITHKLSLEDFAKGFELMTTRPKICGKVVLIP